MAKAVASISPRLPNKKKDAQIIKIGYPKQQYRKARYHDKATVQGQ
jgi:hypothetical protein